jgi:hypothetical protein
MEKKENIMVRVGCYKEAGPMDLGIDAAQGFIEPEHNNIRQKSYG